MSTYKKITSTCTALLLGASLSFSVFAADDPSIKGDLRTNVQQSMNDFINHQTIDGSMYKNSRLVLSIHVLKNYPS